MPAVGDQTGRPASVPSRPAPRRPAPRPRPAPARKPAPAFQPPTRPFAPQQQAAQQKTDTSRARLPKVPLAAPPVIPNPTPKQVHAAKKQLATSVTAAVGAYGTSRERLARRDALLREVRTQPRYAPVRRSISHWTAAEQRLITPERAAANARQTVKPGRAPTKAKLGVGPVNFGTINLTAASRAAVDALPAGIKSGSAEAQFLRNALKDVGTLGKAPFVGAVGVGGVLLDSVTGHRQRALDNATKFAKGVATSTAHEVAHPAESFKAHPVLSVLDALGATSVLGRAAGAAGRAAGRSSTVRPALAMTDDAGQPAVVQRSYSKDESRRQVQIAQDQKREPLKDAKGNVVTVKDRGRDVPVLKSSASEKERFARQRGDFIASRGNMTERQVRDQATKTSKVIGVKGRAARDIVAMAVEGTIRSARTFAPDLKAERVRIQKRLAAHADGSRPFNHTGDLESATNRLKLVDRVLSNPKAMAQGPRIVAEAERHGTKLNAGDVASADAKIIDPAAARRSALSVTALQHMGARHFTVEEHARLERDAGKAEKAAIEAYTAAKTPAARKAALDDLNTAREHRIAVSGREPVALRQHESARAAHSAATSRAKKATEAEAKARALVSKLAAAHRSERGREAHHGPVAAYHFEGQRFVLLKDAVEYVRKNPGADRRHGESADAFRRRKIKTIKRVATTSGEAKRVGELSNARRASKKATERRRAAQKALKGTERGVKQSPLPPIREAIRYGEDSGHLGKKAGEFLSNADIESFLKASGRDPNTVAYLPHRQDVIGNRAHHAQMRPGQRPLLDAGETRTGAAYLDAVTESSQRLLHDQGVRQVVQLNKAKQLDKLVEDHGLRHPAWAKAQRGETLTKGEQRIVDKGGLFTEAEAAELARRAMNDTGERLTPMRAYQAKLDPETKRVIREDLQGPGGMDGLAGRLLNDRIVKPGDGIDPRARNVVLVPSGVVERLEKHLRPAGEIERFFQFLNRPFRMAVLPQPRWLAGNFAESYLVRLPLAGSGLVNVPGLMVDLAATRKILRELDNGTPEMKAAAQAIRAQQTGSGLFIGNRGANVHRTASESMPEFAQQAYGRMVAKLPVVDSMAEMGRSATHWIVAPLRMFFEFNRLGIENPAQRAAFGNQARKDIQAITGSWIKSITLGRAAVKEAAEGHVNTATQQRFMKAQYDLLGKYSGFNPTLRAFTQSVAPFLPWALNAARFVYWTMPAHHTATTAFLIKVQDVMAADWQEIHKGTPPGGLRDAIPVKGGGWLDLQRYTPYGLTGPIANGGGLGSITGQFTPQLGGLTNAVGLGVDPFGRPLAVQPNKAHPDGKPSAAQKALIGGYDLLEAITPYLSTGRRLLEHGETAYADSTIVSPKTKPGTSHGMPAVERTLSPLRPTYLGPGGVKVESAPPPQRSRQQAKSTDPWDAVQTQDAGASQSAADPWDLVK